MVTCWPFSVQFLYTCKQLSRLVPRPLPALNIACSTPKSWKWPGDKANNCLPWIHLYIHVHVHTKSADQNASLPFTKGDLYLNKLPPNILNCSTGEVCTRGFYGFLLFIVLLVWIQVRLVEPKIPLFIRRREDVEAEMKLNLKRLE